MHARRSWLSGRAWAAVIALTTFLAIAPTLRWMEFSGGSENLVVGTVLEMRQGGPWLVPTLKAKLRVNKPPLAAWITALATRPETVAALTDPRHREAAYVDLEWQVRWPALMASCLMLVVVYQLGRTLGDRRIGIASAIMCASSVLFLRFCRSATTDVYLALFVTVANLCFAKILLREDGRKKYGYYLAAGIALGLALMSKGPVALSQTIVPVAIYVVWRRWENKIPIRVAWGPVLLMILVVLAVALPWPIMVLHRMPDRLGVWWKEIVSGGPNGYVADPFWSYLSIFPLMLPWLPVFVFGIMAVLSRPRLRGPILALCMALGPIVVMSCFKQKNERYLLPMVGPCAIVAAFGLARTVVILRRAQWVITAVFALGLPFAGTILKTESGAHWLTVKQFLACLAVAILILSIAWWRHRLLLGTLLIMLLVQAVFIYGYARTARGLSEMKELAFAIQDAEPHALVCNFSPPSSRHKSPVDLEIYLNRVVKRVDGPEDVPEATVMVAWRGKTQGPPPELAEWKEIASVDRGGGRWVAYRRP